METSVALVALGFAVGVVGTLVGAGGGFILVPIMLLLYPQEPAEGIASISLAVVFFNALVGSLSYARMGRIDWRSGTMFACATVPGSILGAMTTGLIPRQGFNALFGIVLMAVAAYMTLRPSRATPFAANGKNCTTRTIKCVGGQEDTFTFQPRIGIAFSLAIGYVSSLLGIGGGVIQVPAMIHLLNFPIHIAVATSQFMLAIMGLSGTIVHIASGAFTDATARMTLLLALGVVAGAPVGARLARRLHGDVIVRVLAVALGIVGLRILLMAFGQ